MNRGRSSRIALDEGVHHIKVGRHNIGTVVRDQARAARHVGVGYQRDFLLAVGRAFLAEIAERGFFDGAETDGCALAANIVERLDFFRIALATRRRLRPSDR